jgi:hypothetical protein
MKDIAYYAGFLSSDDQETIRNASLWQLTDFISEVTNDIYLNCALDDDESVDNPCLEIGWEPLSDRDKLALIRGLCDGIERKLKTELIKDLAT